MNIKQLNKLTDSQIKNYAAQSMTRRRTEHKGGYEHVVFATDQDLDRRKPI
mgnify:CR=1 FL=1